MDTILTVKTDTFEMPYIRFGTKGKAALVILPGLSIKSVLGSADAIIHAYELLADDFDIFLFDRRSNLPEKYSVADMAEDTAEAIRSLDIAPVHLFGVSQGGMMAQCITIAHPELVRSLILGSTTSRVADAEKELVESWIAFAEEKKTEELLDDFAKRIYTTEYYEKFAKIFSLLAREITDEELNRFMILAEGMRGFDVYEKLPEITCPVLVIGAEGDQVLPVHHAKELAEKGGFELYIYEGYSHAVYDEAPDYTARMKRFLTSV